MTRDEALAVLKRHEAELRRRGVRHAALFGSVVRNAARADSDIDVLVELDPAASVGVFEYADLRLFLSELFAGRADVANRAALKAHVRPAAERDAVYAF
jgi:predicted nucleotidyltransferase